MINQTNLKIKTQGWRDDSVNQCKDPSSIPTTHARKASMVVRGCNPSASAGKVETGGSLGSAGCQLREFRVNERLCPSLQNLGSS